MYRAFTRIALCTRILLVNNLGYFSVYRILYQFPTLYARGKKEVLSPDKTTADYNDYNNYNDHIL